MKTNIKNTVNKSALALCGALLLAAGNSPLLSRGVAQASATSSVEVKSNNGKIEITKDGVVVESIDTSALGGGLPDGASLIKQVRIGTNGGGGFAFGNGQLTGKDIPLEKVIAFAYDTDASRLVLPAGLTGKMDLVDAVHGDKGKVREQLKTEFGITVRPETRHTDVWQLTARQTNAPGLKPSAAPAAGSSQKSITRVMVKSSATSTSTNGANARSGNISTQGQDIKGLIKNLQSRFDKPIVDHTGLAGKYDVKLEWSVPADGNESDTVKQALANQAGLELFPGNEAVEVFIVEQAKN